MAAINRELARVLKERGIATDPATLGLTYLSEADHAALIGDPRINVPGVAIHYPSINGATIECVRTRVLGTYRVKGERKPRKYLQPAGSDNRLYFPRIRDWVATARDASVPAIITEGEFKAIKACEEDYACLAVSGVWCWRGQGNDDESSAPIADFNLIVWKGRTVYVAFDSDAVSNPNVRRAEDALVRELFGRGAIPRIVRLPHIAGHAKVGLDDFFVLRGKRAKKEFDALLAEATSRFVLETQNAAELADSKFPAPVFIAEGMITTGLTVLSGAPKIGKSFLGLGLGHSVATGGTAFGVTKTLRGRVLYCALEDVPRRLQSRMAAMNLSRTADLEFVYASNLPRGDDGCEMLTRWCEQHSDARLIIIDTLGKFRGASDVRANMYNVDTADLGAIKAVADRFGIGIIAIHHLRKGGADDVFDRVSGSSGLTATPDTNIVLERERGREEAYLHITGRDVEEQELALSFVDGVWKVLGQAHAVRATRVEKEIMDAIAAASRPLSPKEIGDATGRQRTSLPKFLTKMVNEGRLDWLDGGRYAVRAQPPQKY